MRRALAAWRFWLILAACSVSAAFLLGCAEDTAGEAAPLASGLLADSSASVMDTTVPTEGDSRAVNPSPGITPVQSAASGGPTTSAPASVTLETSDLTMLSISDGDVVIKRTGTSAWIKAEVSMRLHPGDCLKTAGDAWAMITFFEGSTIELEPGTEITIAELKTDGRGANCISVGQQIGRTVSRVKKLSDTASSYEVTTPTGVGAVRGSTMLVEVGGDGTTTIANVEGDIEVIAHGKSVKIPPGSLSKVEKDKEPTEPTKGQPFVPSAGAKAKNADKDKLQGQGQGQGGQGQGQGGQGQGGGNEGQGQGQGGQGQGGGNEGQGQGQDGQGQGGGGEGQGQGQGQDGQGQGGGGEGQGQGQGQDGQGQGGGGEGQGQGQGKDKAK